jgi:hypothetical protein
VLDPSFGNPCPDHDSGVSSSRGSASGSVSYVESIYGIEHAHRVVRAALEDYVETFGT